MFYHNTGLILWLKSLQFLEFPCTIWTRFIIPCTGLQYQMDSGNKITYFHCTKKKKKSKLSKILL